MGSYGNQSRGGLITDYPGVSVRSKGNLLNHVVYRAGRRQAALGQSDRNVRMRTLLFVISEYLHLS